MDFDPDPELWPNLDPGLKKNFEEPQTIVKFLNWISISGGARRTAILAEMMPVFGYPNPSYWDFLRMPDQLLVVRALSYSTFSV